MVIEYSIVFENTPQTTATPTPTASTETVAPQDYSEQFQQIETLQTVSCFLLCLLAGILASSLVFGKL